MNIAVENLTLNDVKLINSEVYHDNRGYYMETYNNNDLEKIIKDEFVQDNLSYNKSKNTFRGFHYQEPPYTQSKLVRVVKGSVLDVIIDLRGNSTTYLEYVTVPLNDNNKSILYVPKGFAHAFITLEDDTILEYKVDSLYNKEHSRTFSMNILEKDYGINYIMSDSDKNAMTFDEENNPFIDWTSDENCN